uniref:Uncharacterized protein n=1 Tax=Rhizophora mucronata TaxID=61149 RepID=A0A2P2P2Q5_RHIMU
MEKQPKNLNFCVRLKNSSLRHKGSDIMSRNYLLQKIKLSKLQHSLSRVNPLKRACRHIQKS